MEKRLRPGLAACGACSRQRPRYTYIMRGYTVSSSGSKVVTIERKSPRQVSDTEGPSPRRNPARGGPAAAAGRIRRVITYGPR